MKVLGGMRGPSDAAKAMGVALPRYYLLETRALPGLILAMESLPRGPRGNSESEIAALNKQIARLPKSEQLDNPIRRQT